MSKHGLALLLIALVGCKYGALPSLGHHDDGSTGTDSTTVDSKAPDGAMPDAAPDAPPDAAICPSTSACVEAPMSGWSGPAIFYQAPTGTVGPACSGAYDMSAVSLKAGLDGGTPTCACMCGAATGTSCGSATLQGFNNNLCITAGGPTWTLPPSTCTSFALSGSSHYELFAPDVTGGTCASTETKTIPVPTWATEFQACTGSAAFTSAGCAANQVCAPRPPANFDSQICIYAPGNVACPSGSAYSNRTVWYNNYTDTRTCSGNCSCGAPSGSCGGGVTFTQGTGTCGDINDGTIGVASCHAPPIQNPTYATYEPSPMAACTPSNDALMGALTPTQPTTFCCLTPQ